MATPVLGDLDLSGVASFRDPVRLTATHTTGSLAALVGYETSTITLAKSFRLILVTVSAVARVRLYDRAAKQTSDLSRGSGNRPYGDHGLIYEFVGTTSILSAAVNPTAYGSSNEASPSTTIPITTTNLSTTSQAITVTFTYVVWE